MFMKRILNFLLPEGGHSGVVFSVHACQTEGPRVNFTLGQNFFTSTGTRANLASNSGCLGFLWQNKASEDSWWHLYFKSCSDLEIWRHWNFTTHTASMPRGHNNLYHNCFGTFIRQEILWQKNCCRIWPMQEENTVTSFKGQQKAPYKNRTWIFFFLKKLADHLHQKKKKKIIHFWSC